MTDAGPPGLFQRRFSGHGSRIGLQFRSRGEDWAELALPWSEELMGDAERGVLASGPIIALMDVATSMSVWARVGFVPHATLDLRIDYLRPATRGKTVIGRGECLRIARSVSFTRGLAHDGDPANPIAHVAATFMLPEESYPRWP